MEQEDQETREQGYWWLAESPDQKLNGTITYAPRSGLKVDLVGSLLAIEKAPQKWGSFNVWGSTVRGKAISLLNAYQSNLQIHVPGIPTSSVESSRGIIGGHYRTAEDVVVHTLNVEFDYLTAWAGQSGITQKHDSQNKSSQIVVTAAPSVALGECDGIQVEIAPWVSQSHSRDKLILQERCGLQLHSESSRPLPDFEPLISSFRTLLTFAVGEAAHTRKMIGNTGEKVAEIQGKPIWQEIEVIREIRVPLTRREIHAENMLFTLRDFPQTTADTFAKFLGTERKLKPVFELFFPIYFYPEMASPQQFLNLVYATEAFHRATVGGQYQSDEQYEKGLKKNLQKVISGVPEDFRQSLDTKLKFLHQYSLRKRLRDILKRFEPLISPYIPDRDTFIESVAEARNSLVHASVDRSSPNYMELWKLAQQLGLILEIALLSEIGFEEDRVGLIIGRGKRAQLIRLNILNVA